MTTSAPALSTGRDMRTYTCIRALAMFRPVDLAYVPHDRDEPAAPYLEIENVEFHKIEPSRGWRRAAGLCEQARSRHPRALLPGHEP